MSCEASAVRRIQRSDLTVMNFLVRDDMKEPAQHIKNVARVTSVEQWRGLYFTHCSLTAAFLMLTVPSRTVSESVGPPAPLRALIERAVKLVRSRGSSSLYSFTICPVLMMVALISPL